MKTRFIFPIAFFAMLIFGSARKEDKKEGDKWDIVEQDKKKKEPALILSIPDWAIGKLLMDPPQKFDCKSLQALRVYDNKLKDSLLYHPKIKYVITRKSNPCCPCIPGGSMCCRCTSMTTFAAPSSMDASLKIEGQTTRLTKDSTRVGIDFFSIPASVPAAGLTLIIDGNGIGAPLKFSMDN